MKKIIKKFIEEHGFAMLCTFFSWIILIWILYAVQNGFQGLVAKHLINNVIKNVLVFVQDDITHLKKEGDEVANLDELKKALETQNNEAIKEIISREQPKRDVGSLGVTDKNGFVISRTIEPNRKGDNTFLINAYGKIVGDGKSVETIDVLGVDPSKVIMITGRPVVDNGEMIGALFASYNMDDAYAIRLKERFARERLIRTGFQIAFYTRDYGIFGSSFKDSSVKNSLKKFFNNGSSWIKESNKKGIISIHGEYYFVENIFFHGITGDRTGALIFIPLYVPIQITVFAVGIILSAYLLLIPSRRYLRRLQHKHVKVFGTISVVVILGTVIMCGVMYKRFVKNATDITIPSKQVIYNSTLRFSPDASVFEKSYEQNISILLDTGGESINTAGIYLSYDKNLIDVLDIDTEDSACDFFIDKTIDNETGHVSIDCSILHALNDSGSSLLAKLVIKPKKEGRVTLSFDDTTKILASDGLATDVLRYKINGSYVITSKVEEFLRRYLGVSKPVSPIIYSFSHPNTERWYRSRKIEMVWTDYGPGSVYRYSIDRDEKKPLLKNYTSTTDNRATVEVNEEGTFDFHVAVETKNGIGEIAHFPIHIDYSPPETLVLDASENFIKKGDVVRFVMAGKDNISGLAGGYYIKVDDHILYPVKGEVYIPFPEEGEYTVSARIFDKAGNYRDTSVVVNVSP